MTLVALGGMDAGVALPGAALAVEAGVQGIGLALPDIIARLQALADFHPAEISLAAELELAQKTLLGVQTALAAGLAVPSISDQLAVVGAQVAALGIAVAQINAYRSVLVSLQGSLTVGGIAGYAYEGPLSSLGDELDAEVGGIPVPVHAVILVATTAPAWAALQTFIRTQP